MFVAGGYDVLGSRFHDVQDALAVKATNEPLTGSDWKPTAGDDICLSEVVSSKRLMDSARPTRQRRLCSDPQLRLHTDFTQRNPAWPEVESVVLA